jgi:L-ascorbate metabolism protein UlaG (beta-lactamase superfamily)
MKIQFGVIVMVLFSTLASIAQEAFEKDIIKTFSGDLEISFIGHGTLMLKYNGKIIYIDPYSQLADCDKLPKADLILVTHEHFDHLDLKALTKLRKPNTVIIHTRTCAEKVKGGTIMANGDVQTLMGIKVEAIPAYNIVHKREDGQPYHSKGTDNGYVLTFDDQRIYVAGDTENTADMKALKNINCAFLPMNMPYTMTPEMVADAVKVFKPKILYPYHFGETDTSKLVSLLRDSPEIEVRIRKMK